ncbi:PIN domain-containing protein [Ralstonia pseudosolanacearum]|uniref:PIN domain-containing protein n=1 Tax=Ralstonia pseudosolanacearum TaxID=1310165 RepID=UPI0006BCDA74|nr:PIN domain-containing protein [Ralstonia pseudosolanacearum]AKZ28288.1 pilus assembly protein [Ralstonia solanacearum]MDO3564253.1 PIN domain-containing protein [Ralstonia pseudosolanacearum]MDO3574163.1 PIN domain-containing protein [Ralstonia pseudosolanacearum]MDO3615876.1 PIN domain-containing protein [Ralstonia pseudosolanacearum]MDO3621745.1 PIN domain-containing protein [Ralstonia pseudosolanacearum]
MPATEAFFDSNVVLYLLSADTAKADAAETLLMTGGVVSVQVLNETTHVMRRKLAMPWHAIEMVQEAVRAQCRVEPLTLETHDLGRRIAERYGLSVYDALIVAAALLAGCNVLYSEDMQHGLVIEQHLRIVNPFPARA